MKLTEKQLEHIRTELKEKGLKYDPIEAELIDDIASTIEVQMELGATYEEAFEKIFRSISHEDIDTIQKNIIQTLRTNNNLRRFENRQALFLMAGLSAWVVLEFLIGEVSGIKELGPLYGSLSLLLVIFWIYRSLKTVENRFFEGFASFRNILFAGMKVSLLSSIFFCGFLILFWTYIYPDFDEAFQIQPEELVYTANQLLVSSVLASGIAIFIMGFLVSLISALRLKSAA